ncbi:hypothetical protein [Halobacterium sp. R2-5]|uniref:DUF7344 domain-containing protein n=1 Tax=Halobacterium sp. R2-5 TaxID=2715751 RepID=UPI001423E594|nr:hypothetical protein [Halobacterium sp. R2-5]NIB98522.1 hypothetical protein [Halobacterium sp. R2-5]
MLEATHGGGESDSEIDSVPSTEPEANADTPEEEPAEQLPLDITFEILKNRRRRLVLEYVRDTEEPVTIGELAEHIAAIENDTTVQQLDAQQRKRVYIGLYQCHLPKMDDAGVVDFNQGRGRIEVGNHVESLYEYLDVGAEEESGSAPSQTAYAGGIAAFAVLFLAAQLSSAYTLATAVVVVFLAVVFAVSLWSSDAFDSLRE